VGQRPPSSQPDALHTPSLPSLSRASFLPPLCPVTGSLFAQSDALSVQLTNQPFGSFGGIVVKRCESVTVLSPSTLTCVLPSLNSTELVALGDQWTTVTVYNNVTSYSNPVTVQLYRSAVHPAVLNVKGCAGLDATGRGVVGCVTSSLITITGANFGADVQVDVYAFDLQLSYICQLASISQGTQITCVLPYIAHLEAELTLPIRVSSNYLASNWLLAIGYSAGLTPNTPAATTSGTSYRTAFIACVVLLGVVSIAWAVTLILCFRQQSLHKKPMNSAFSSERDESTFRSGARGAVEMS
jgi:hypothetical protein